MPEPSPTYQPVGTGPGLPQARQLGGPRTQPYPPRGENQPWNALGPCPAHLRANTDSRTPRVLQLETSGRGPITSSRTLWTLRPTTTGLAQPTRRSPPRDSAPPTSRLAPEPRLPWPCIQPCQDLDLPTHGWLAAFAQGRAWQPTGTKVRQAS